MKHSAHSQSYRTFNATATAVRGEEFISGIIFGLLTLLIGFGLAVAFAYQTDSRPVQGTRACNEAQTDFDGVGLISWQARSDTDTYEKYLLDRRAAQCKAASLVKYVF